MIPPVCDSRTGNKHQRGSKERKGWGLRSAGEHGGTGRRLSWTSGSVPVLLTSCRETGPSKLEGQLCSSYPGSVLRRSFRFLFTSVIFTHLVKDQVMEVTGRFDRFKEHSQSCSSTIINHSFPFVPPVFDVTIITPSETHLEPAAAADVPWVVLVTSISYRFQLGWSRWSPGPASVCHASF